MYRRAARWLICLTTLIPAGSVHAQGVAAPSPDPLVTAENEPWYLSGEPLTHDGNVYYPVGPLTAFNRNEMVRSGFYRGIPLYTRTTYEPWSVVYVPLPGGFLQPYIRRRSGDIAGTIGSIGPGVPIDRDDTSRALTSAPQAPGPPTGLLDTPIDRVLGAAPGAGAVGTAGRVPEAAAAGGMTADAPPQEPATRAPRLVVTPRPRPMITLAGPTGANDAYVEFQSRRWYASGAAVEMDSRLHRIGEYHGFPVYARDGETSTIYIPVTSNVRSLLTPYSARR